MRRKRIGRSVVMALFGLLIAVPATLLTSTPAAFAEGGCCQVSVDNLPAQFPAGGDPTPFTVHVVNQSQDSIRNLNVAFLLQADGLVGDLVHLQRRRASGDPRNVGTFTQRGVHSGAVMANDQIDFGEVGLPPGGGLDITYQLSFSKKVESTPLTLSMQVRPKRDDGGISSAGPYQTSILAAGEPIPTPTPSPVVSDSPIPADSTAPADQSPLAGAGSSGGGSSLAWLAYALGALLLLGGVGVIVMLWRRGPEQVETDEDEPRQYGQPAYPYAPTQVAGYDLPRRPGPPGVYGTPGHHTAPTAQYPIPQDPYAAHQDQTWIDPAAGR